MTHHVVLLALIFVLGAGARELVFVQTVSRHGDRAPLGLPYPLDQYTESSWPRGWGGLTNLGIKETNELGNWLRQRYVPTLLTGEYNAKEVYIRSSDSDRALASAQSIVSGLFPAAGKFQWQTGDTWQPIPVHSSSPGETDLLTKPGGYDCPPREKLVTQSDDQHAAIYNVQYKDLFTSLSINTGIANFSFNDVGGIYDITREITHNMSQPTWVTQAWPQYGNQTTMDICSALKTVKQLDNVNSFEKSRPIGGFLLNNWIQNALSVANKTMKPNKMLIYSSHDTTILALMYTMGNGNNLPPPYASVLFMEIYANNGDYEVELYYRNDTSVEPYRIDIPNCGDPCLVNKLSQIYSDVVLPTVDDVNKLCGLPIGCSSSPASNPKEYTASILVSTYIVFSYILYLVE